MLFKLNLWLKWVSRIAIIYVIVINHRPRFSSLDFRFSTSGIKYFLKCIGFLTHFHRHLAREEKKGSGIAVEWELGFPPQSGRDAATLISTPITKPAHHQDHWWLPPWICNELILRERWESRGKKEEEGEGDGGEERREGGGEREERGKGETEREIWIILLSVHLFQILVRIYLLLHNTYFSQSTFPSSNLQFDKHGLPQAINKPLLILFPSPNLSF